MSVTERSSFHPDMARSATQRVIVVAGRDRRPGTDTGMALSRSQRPAGAIFRYGEPKCTGSELNLVLALSRAFLITG